VNVFGYDDSQSRLVQFMQSIGSSWNVIEVPRGFDVIDVVVVDNSNDAPVIYGIQITRTPTPFRDHRTFDTCTPESRKKLENLWRVISNHFKLDETVSKFYVMLAPNCEKSEFRPPVGHSNDCYFSPSSILPKDNSTDSKARSSRATKKGSEIETSTS